MSPNSKTILPEKNQVRKKRKKQGMWSQAVVRLFHDKLGMVGLIGILALVLISVCAPLIAPFSPTEMDLKFINAAPSLAHPFGTDALGRDILSRLIYGGRYSLAVGFLASVVGQFAALILGMIAGYAGGKVDNAIMRTMDVIMSIPATMISIIVAMTFGTKNFIGTIVALGLGGIAGGVRMCRGLVLTVRQEEYLRAAQAINCSTPRILFRHVFPNIISVMIIGMATGIGNMIMVAAGLSVIGLGIQPPAPEWGAMLSAGRDYITHYPHLVIFPGLVIFICVFFFNLLGDGLRDAIDPKLRK
ncbi:MAG: ABC transporter permease [Lachnospiraceae bacterium]|jgi:peptide/nickel transport system permease protein|nr:ABC transporter permease [Lachnospiraceae bacterium]